MTRNISNSVSLNRPSLSYVDSKSEMLSKDEIEASPTSRRSVSQKTDSAARTVFSKFEIFSGKLKWLLPFLAIPIANLILLPIVAGIGSLISKRFSLELSALFNLCRRNYNVIFEDKKGSGGKLMLGAMPNKMGAHAEFLKNNESVGAVLSCLDDEEATRQDGVAKSYLESEWKERGIDFRRIDIEDHTLMLPDEMHASADFIHRHLKEGTNVYVHCRGGAGRSATAIAAYLIKYQGMSIDETIKLIETQRPVSTIKKKIPALVAFCLDIGRPEPKEEVLAKLENDSKHKNETGRRAKLILEILNKE